MGFWARLFRSKRTVAAAAEEHLLVVSDLHLGEDILNEGPPQLAEYIRSLNRCFAEFVAAHRTGRREGRPWHLVINGDMFDFIKVSLVPGREGEPVETPEPPRPNTPANVVWKLERIVEIHRPLFKELALFLLAGNRVTLLGGNHDAEFFFPEVREALRRRLVELAGRLHSQSKRDEPFDAEVVGSRLAFRVWFEAAARAYHIEHGHQYDEFCSVEYPLAPLDRQGAETLATPVMQRIVPYFAELLGDFSTHSAEQVGFARMIRFLLAFPPQLLWWGIKMYWVVAFELLKNAGASRRAELAAHKARHEERLRELAASSPYSHEQLERLDRLKAVPAEYSLLKVARAAFVDRFAVAALMLVGLAPALFFELGAGLAWCGTILLGGGFTLYLLASRHRTDAVAQLRRAAGRIAELTGARYVVFGHSHQPELVVLGDGAAPPVYLNAGSWVTREVLRGEAGCGMTYVEITRAGAALKRWRGGAEQPALLAASEPGDSGPGHAA